MATTVNATNAAASARTSVHDELRGVKSSHLLPLASVAAVFIGRTRRATRIDDDGHVDHDVEHKAPSPTIPAPTSTATKRVVTARECAGQLPHVVSSVSAFLDVALAPYWTIPRACEHGHLAMLPRLASREPADMNKHYRAHLFSKGLVSAAQRSDLPIVQWLCCEYCPSGFAWKGMEAAAVAGQLSVLQWLVARYEYIQWDEKLLTRVAANGHLDVLQWMYTHPNHAECSSEAAGDAVVQDHLPVLKWLLSMYPEFAKQCGYAIADVIRSGDIERVQRLVDLGLEFDFRSTDLLDAAVHSGSLEMVQWIDRLASVTRCDASSDEVVRSRDSTLWMIGAARQGHLDIVKWLRERYPKDSTTYAVASAASGGYLHVVQWFHVSGTDGFSADAMSNAAANGHLEVVKWLHEHHSECLVEGCARRAMSNAAANGHLEVAKWFHEHYNECCTERTMAYAAAAGHSEVVQWLHEQRHEGCTFAAMDWSAARGRLEIVKWLHENRTEGCTADAMTDAATRGHFEIVKWLHEHRSEGCTTDAMDGAAAEGHFEIVKWLHKHRTEGCTAHAMNQAVYSGHFEVMMWLHANRTEGCTTEAARLAIVGEHYEMLRWLADEYPHVVNVDRPPPDTQYRVGMQVLLEHIKRARAALQA